MGTDRKKLEVEVFYEGFVGHQRKGGAPGIMKGNERRERERRGNGSRGKVRSSAGRAKSKREMEVGG